MVDLLVQSLPICLVISLTMVALEEDELQPYLKRLVIHFGQLYGGIIAFSLCAVGIAHLFAG